MNSNSSHIHISTYKCAPGTRCFGSPPPGIDKMPSFLGSLGPPFFRSNLRCVFSFLFGHVWHHFGGHFSCTFPYKSLSKIGPFLDDLLEALGDHQRRLLGVLGSLVGGSVFQIRCKKQYEIHGFKNTPLRNPGFLEPLSEAILQYFIGFWIPE